jgi:hypothetical protein
MADECHGLTGQCGGGSDKLRFIGRSERTDARPDAGLAVSEQVDGDDAIAVLQVVNELAPLPKPARRAVDQDDPGSGPLICIFEIEGSHFDDRHENLVRFQTFGLGACATLNYGGCLAN